MKPFTSFQDPSASGPIEKADVQAALAQLTAGSVNNLKITSVPDELFCVFQDPCASGPADPGTSEGSSSAIVGTLFVAVQDPNATTPDYRPLHAVW